MVDEIVFLDSQLIFLTGSVAPKVSDLNLMACNSFLLGVLYQCASLAEHASLYQCVSGVSLPYSDQVLIQKNCGLRSVRP